MKEQLRVYLERLTTIGIKSRKWRRIRIRAVKPPVQPLS